MIKMEQEEINKIKDVIGKYKTQRNELIEKRNEVNSKLRNGEITPWTRDLMIDDLYKDFEETQERSDFKDLAQIATEDVEFEKYFRAAHLQAFFNINLNPESL
jgi:hypothetical protein